MTYKSEQLAIHRIFDNKIYNGKILHDKNFFPGLGINAPFIHNGINNNVLSNNGSDIESALFHAYAEENSFAFVFEFEIPLKENHFWEGYPYLWKGEKRGSNSTWFAQMKPIPKEYIKKIHQISYKDWISQKNHGF